MKYFIILLILFYIFLVLINNKNNKNEYFLNFNIRNNKPILWVNKNLNDIEQHGFKTLFKKSKEPYYSNSFINNSTFLTGFYF